MSPSDQTADLLSKRLVEALQPCPLKVVLFGSRARNDAAADSDYDLLVVWTTDLPPAERAYVANRAVRDLGVAVDVVVMTPDEVAAQADWCSSIVHTALREGRVLHEAA